MTANQRNRKSEERIDYWGRAYLGSTEKSYERAVEWFDKGDPFTAYLYLFVAFNNLYCLLARFKGTGREKIKAALERLRSEDIEHFYTDDYRELISDLNDRCPEQCAYGPDAGTSARGITNMKDYFLGKEAADCVRHVAQVASGSASTETKRQTLAEVASSLLYTVRNNQFHAVKGLQNLADEDTLRIAYLVLQPVVKALLPVARSRPTAEHEPH